MRFHDLFSEKTNNYTLLFKSLRDFWLANPEAPVTMTVDDTNKVEFKLREVIDKHMIRLENQTNEISLAPKKEFLIKTSSIVVIEWFQF